MSRKTLQEMKNRAVEETTNSAAEVSSISGTIARLAEKTTGDVKSPEINLSLNDSDKAMFDEQDGAGSGMESTKAAAAASASKDTATPAKTSSPIHKGAANTLSPDLSTIDE